MLSAILWHLGCVGCSCLAQGGEVCSGEQLAPWAGGALLAPCLQQPGSFCWQSAKGNGQKLLLSGAPGGGCGALNSSGFQRGCRALLPGDLKRSRTPPGSHPSAGVLGPLLLALPHSHGQQGPCGVTATVLRASGVGFESICAWLGCWSQPSMWMGDKESGLCQEVSAPGELCCCPCQSKPVSGLGAEKGERYLGKASQ